MRWLPLGTVWRRVSGVTLAAAALTTAALTSASFSSAAAFSFKSGAVTAATAAFAPKTTTALTLT